MLRIYNTLSRKKEAFKPIKDKKVGLYTCGPTVYWLAHIGNLRSYLFSDVLKRTLDYNHYYVKYVMNFTDVDDKTIKGTIKKYGKNADKYNLRDYTKKYIEIFKSDIKKLNIGEPYFARATDTIEDIKKEIKILIKKGFAYSKDGSVYFDIQKYNQKYKDYGNLAGKNFLKGLKLGETISVDEYQKENIGDFVLWKKWDEERDKNIFWTDSILGKGRPGWHIECSVISMKHLGKQFDIHTGGVDLIFPHHSNEIAQSQAIGDKIPFVKYWIHPEHLIVEGEKMAKSKGNFYSLKDIEEKFNPLAFRYLCLSAHYRSKLNFTWKSLESSQNALNKIYEKVRNIKTKSESGSLIFRQRAGLCQTCQTCQACQDFQDKFLEHINNDLDTVRALALIWKLIEAKNISEQEKYNLLLDFDKVFGFGFAGLKKETIPINILKLVEEREKCREKRQWELADDIREKVKKMGYLVEDTKKGQKIKKS